MGGAVDKTGGTLNAPDMDFNIEWDVDKEIIENLIIKPTDDGQSGQYLLQVRRLS